MTRGPDVGSTAPCVELRGCSLRASKSEEQRSSRRPRRVWEGKFTPALDRQRSRPSAQQGRALIGAPRSHLSKPMRDRAPHGSKPELLLGASRNLLQGGDRAMVAATRIWPRVAIWRRLIGVRKKKILKPPGSEGTMPGGPCLATEAFRPRVDRPVRGGSI